LHHGLPNTWKLTENIFLTIRICSPSSCNIRISGNIRIVNQFSFTDKQKVERYINTFESKHRARDNSHCLQDVEISFCLCFLLYIKSEAIPLGHHKHLFLLLIMACSARYFKKLSKRHWMWMSEMPVFFYHIECFMPRPLQVNMRPL